MFSTLNKLKEKIESTSEEEKNKSSVANAQPQKTEEDIKKEKVQKFLNALDDVAWDLHDDSSFYRDTWSEKQEKKRKAACEEYGKGRNLYPVLMIDTTTFGSGKCGMMFTEDGIYIGESDGSRAYKEYIDLFGKKFKTSGGSFYIGNRDYSFHASSEMNKLAPVIALLNSYFS